MNSPNKDIFDNNINNDRVNVLYSPFRKREVNPQDWDSKMTFWKSNILKWCISSNTCVFNLMELNCYFKTNERSPSCLSTVLEEMTKNNEIVHFTDLMSKHSTESWSMWAVNSIIKAPLIWSFNKLKQSLISSSTPYYSLEDKYVHIHVLQKYCDQIREGFKSQKTIMDSETIKGYLNLKDDLNVKVVLHWLHLHGYVSFTTVNDKTILKISKERERCSSLSEADLALYQLEQNEQTLKDMLEQLEKEKQDADQEVRNYLKKGMRQVAKSCLRKKKELDKCIDKRATALENIQVLLSRVKDAESDGEILESYRLGLSALKSTFKNAGLSEDNVGQTMDKIKEVLEVHDEIQHALSEPMTDNFEDDLENELAAILSNNTAEKTSGHQQAEQLSPKHCLPDLPEPPSHSPTSSATRDTPRTAAQRLPQLLNN